MLEPTGTQVAVAGVASADSTEAARRIVHHIMSSIYPGHREALQNDVARQLEVEINVALHEPVDWLSSESRERARVSAIGTLNRLVEQARYIPGSDTALARQQIDILQSRKGTT